MRVALRLERRTCVRKVAGSSPGRSGCRVFLFVFSPGSTFCTDSYFGIRSTPVLPQWPEKDPGHSAISAGGRLQLNSTHPMCVVLYKVREAEKQDRPKPDYHVLVVGQFQTSAVCWT